MVFGSPVGTVLSKDNAFSIVFTGLDSVPGLESLPFFESTYTSLFSNDLEITLLVCHNNTYDWA